MFGIIKESYKFLIFNFPKVLWITSGLLFLEISSRWLLLNHYQKLWANSLLIIFHVTIYFTQVFVIIDLTKLVLAEKMPKITNPSLVYLKTLGVMLLIGLVIYAMVSLLEYLSPDYLFSSLYVIIFQLSILILVFNYIYARLNIAIPLVLSGHSLLSLFNITKSRYLDWLLASVLIYIPFVILLFLASFSYFLIIVKILFFNLIYIFSAIYVSGRLKD